MKKHKYRVILDFDLNLRDDEELEKDSLKDFKECMIKYLQNGWEGKYGYFHADHVEYSADVSPTNIEVKLEQR